MGVSIDEYALIHSFIYYEFAVDAQLKSFHMNGETPTTLRLAEGIEYIFFICGRAEKLSGNQ
jgi:hypothetical protein